MRYFLKILFSCLVPKFRINLYSSSSSSNSKSKSEDNHHSNTNTNTNTNTNKTANELIMGSGAQPGTIPSDFEHAVGVERLELLGKLAGKSIFSSSSPETQNLSVKGTGAAPVLVESVFDADSIEKERIVGCSGHPKGSHEINFFWVRSEKETTRCPECGQSFKLQLLQ